MSKRIWLLVAALAACTNAHGPQEGTQTGNPPVLDRGKVKLEVGTDEVHVIGKPGAATPGGATIEITNLTTGKVTEGMAQADGSFDVRVDGSPNDAFVVRAVANDEQSFPVYVVRGGAEIPGKDDGSLTCDQYTELGRALLTASAATADRSCSSADDCLRPNLSVSCVPGCDFAYVSKNAGLQQITASISALDVGLCVSWAEAGCKRASIDCSQPPPPTDCVAGQCVARTELSCDESKEKAGQVIFEALQTAASGCEGDEDCVQFPLPTSCVASCGPVVVHRERMALFEQALDEVNGGICATFAGRCELPQVSCGPGLPVPRCEAGQCTQVVPDEGMPDCTTCFAETLKWGSGAGFARYIDQSELAPCAHYTHRRSPLSDPNAGELSCERDLVACNSVASTGAVMSALGHPDVQRAFGEIGKFGSFPFDGGSFRVTYGLLEIEVGGSCESGPPDCIPPSPGVAALVQLLQDIDETMLMTEECADFPR